MSAQGSTASTAARSSTTSTRCRSDRLQVHGARRVEPHSLDVGDAVLPDRRQADGRVLRPADRLRRVGRVRAGRSRLPDLDRLLLRHRRRGARRWRSPATRRARTSCCRRPLQNSLVISDLPGPTGGIMLKSATGATIIVNDTGIYIQNGKGASHRDDRADGDSQQRRVDDGVRRTMPGLPAHVGATVLCAHGGQAQPTAPNPRVLVERAAGRHDGGAVRRSPAVRSCRRAATAPCVTAQWMVGATRVLVAGQPVAAARQPGRLRAQRHAAAPVVATRRA